MTTSARRKDKKSEIAAQPAPPGARAVVACIAGWIVPGGGHLVLGRLGRGLAGLAVILTLFLWGLKLDGQLARPVPGEVLSVPASFACLGVGPAYFIAAGLTSTHHGMGDILSATNEMGTTFVICAGLLNMLLILDAFDIAAGRKG